MIRKILLTLAGVAMLLSATVAQAMYGYSVSTQALTSATTTTPVPIISVTALHASDQHPNAGAPWLQPGILVILSAGASLTYSVEVTGDDVLTNGYVASTGNWVAMTNESALTASSTVTLGAAVTAVRLHITSYSSGTATMQVIQQTVT